MARIYRRISGFIRSDQPVKADVSDRGVLGYGKLPKAGQFLVLSLLLLALIGAVLVLL